jgi:transcriptional regulator with XRE-family HTH domain
VSYNDDMATTQSELEDLFARVNEATKLLQRSAFVPDEVAKLIDSFEATLGAATPLRLEADPYLKTTLWAAAFRAEKALRHDDDEQKRRDVRIALEQFRHALRDIVERRPYDDGAPVRDVLIKTADALDVPQKELAELLGVSVRQLQRWLAPAGFEPSGDDAARIRAVGNVVNQLRHSFTGPGVMAWFDRRHPVLRRRPIELLDDPLKYPELVGAATAARATTG